MSPCERRVTTGSDTVALFPTHGDDLDSLLRGADMAMYDAKSEASGVRFYTPSDEPHMPGRLTMLADLSTAIERGDLHLEYQPIVELTTGRITRVEALLRWDHPELDRVNPMSFIPQAEQTDLMGPLTDHVLRTALLQCGTWHSEGIRVVVSVNASARNLHDLRFPGRVAQMLEAHDLDPGWLSLEITENTVMDDPIRSASVLGHLRSLGVMLSMDDFGTGYSSLANLRHLTIDQIKIDRSFVAGMTRRAGDLAIVQSVVELGRNLGLGTVAEGVETSEALELLRDLGCDEFQGYLAARPLPAEALADLLHRGRIDLGLTRAGTRP